MTIYPQRLCQRVLFITRWPCQWVLSTKDDFVSGCWVPRWLRQSLLYVPRWLRQWLISTKMIFSTGTIYQRWLRQNAIKRLQTVPHVTHFGSNIFYRITIVSYSYTKLLNFSVSIGEIYIIFSKIIFVRDLTWVLCLKTKENEYCKWVTCQMVCKRFCNSTLHFSFILHGMVMWLMMVQQLYPSTKVMGLEIQPRSFGVTGVKRSFSLKMI